MAIPMLRMLCLAAALLLRAAIPALAADAPVAAAPDRPPIPSTRNAVLGYHIRPGAGEEINVRVSLLPDGRAMRVDLPDFTFMLADPAHRSVVMVVPAERMVVNLAWSEGPQVLFLLDDGASYTRKAEATVAGQRCTTWDVKLDRALNTVCVTPEGLVLRNQSTDAAGRRNLVEAYAVQYGKATDAEFQVPPGYERLQPDLPQLLPTPRQR